MPLCLIVDDEEDHREISAIIARGAGLDIIDAENGKEALEKCQEQIPDVIFLDWMMPDMDGAEFIYNLRQMEGGDKPYVIMCSARNSENAVNMAYSMGADAYFTKPFNPEDVAEKLAEALVE